ncbi:hypothetical protein HAX54_044544 [Datura stramonium]|uniref:Uncharacterized protein n=1 Tax=Datura stramonium TaxID=4076 RepID=A0ABS8SPJ5_DATST|nr:hypothetical protein [Datura stramonium]
MSTHFTVKAMSGGLHTGPDTGQCRVPSGRGVEARVPRERGDQMIRRDIPFDPFRVKGALGRSKKKPNVDLDGQENNDQGVVEPGLVLPGLLTLLSVWRRIWPP